MTSSADETKRVMSRLNLVIRYAHLLSPLLDALNARRPMYSNPPLHGARIVANVFGDAELSALWRKEVKGMADRIKDMRHSLVDNLRRLGNTRKWTHITDQVRSVG